MISSRQSTIFVQTFAIMVVGISTYSFPWRIGVLSTKPQYPMTAQDLLRYAVKQGISHIQFGDNLPLHLCSANELSDIASFAQTESLTIEVGMKGLTEANVETYIQVAAQLKSPFLRVVVDDENYHPATEEMVRLIKTLIPRLEENNLVLAIENHDRFSSRELETIITTTDPSVVGICLDTANSYGALEGYRETVSVLAPYTVNLHLKDISIERVESKMGFVIRGEEAGKGMLDIPWILDQVRYTGRCKSVTLELWSSFTESLEQTIANEEQKVSNSIKYLKHLLHE